MADINSFTVSAAAWVPADQWAAATDALRRRYLVRVGELAIVRKKKELQTGIGVDGSPLAKVKPASRPDGGTGKPLEPHYAESRSVKWLRSSPGLSGGTVTIWWSHGWGRILGYHARGEVKGAPVRDVIGLTKSDTLDLQGAARAFWKAIVGQPKVAAKVAAKPAPKPAPKPKPTARPKPATPKPTARPAKLPKPTAPAPAPAPAPKPGEPILPGRPMAERLAAYTEGDAIVRGLEAGHAAVAAAKAEMTRLDAGTKAFLAGMTDADWKDPAKSERGAAMARSLMAAQAAYERARSDAAQAAAASLKLPAGRLGDWTATGVDRLQGLEADPELARRAEAVRQTIASIVHAPGTPLSIAWQAIASGSSRAYQTGGDQVYLPPGTKAPVIGHEIGHALENQLPGAHAAVLAFAQHRFGDEPLQSLADLFPWDGYKSSETGRKDKFAALFGERSAYYVGKPYRDNSEVLSMGLQALLTDPGLMATVDPEFAKFTIGLLRGDLR